MTLEMLHVRQVPVPSEPLTMDPSDQQDGQAPVCLTGHPVAAGQRQLWHLTPAPEVSKVLLLAFIGTLSLFQVLKATDT
jgi:hypothetical protein